VGGGMMKRKAELIVFGKDLDTIMEEFLLLHTNV